MKLFKESTQYLFFKDYFQNNEVIILKDKATGEISFSAESVAKCLGYNDFPDMMCNDDVLDAVNEEWQATGVFPLHEITKANNQLSK